MFQGYDDELGSALPVASLLYLDKMLYNFHAAEDEKCEANPRKKKSEMDREPYPGYISFPCSYPCSDPYYAKVPHPVPQRIETSNSEETASNPPEPEKTEGLEPLSSEVLDQDSTTQILEECCDSAENASDVSPKSEMNSLEENVAASRKENTQGLYSHEFQDMVRSVDK